MFYLYSIPSCLQQKFHNSLAKSIELVAASIGIIRKSENRKSKIWRYMITFLLIAYNTIMSYSVSPSTATPSELLNSILGRMSLTTYSFLIIECLVMIRMQKKNISKCFMYAENVHQMCRNSIYSENSSSRGLFHTFVMKIGVDMALMTTITSIEVISFVVEPTFFSFFNAIMSPTTAITYNCIGTLYYVSLSLALKSTETIKTGVNQDVGTCSQVIGKYIKKIHKTFEITLLFVMCEAFLSIICQVRLVTRLLTY